uniref:Ulp1 protease family, C-terminal catalytic domain-containing protein n=1 Tax=Tanacetum cinerariifolium TaxID=118510 RepID=A0A6L2MCZ9_TANCI|nr:ulp1 protease family, C-terminal catalytic domain-containing protein [Tanacetum cinerariifolium]
MRLEEMKHPRAKDVLNKKPTIIRSKWGTTKNDTDYGIFLMMHMEHYNGETSKNWNLKFSTEKQGNTLDIIKMRVSTIPTNNNQRSSLIPRNSQIAQPDMNTSQDIKMKMVDDNVGIQMRQNAVQNDGNEVGQNAVHNSGIQIVENLEGLSVVSEIANQYGNVNVETTPTEGNGNGINGNSIRCYNCRGKGHYESNCIVKPKKRDVAYLQQQLQIALEEEAGIQSTQEEFEFMAAADAYEEIKRVKVDQLRELVDQARVKHSKDHFCAPTAQDMEILIKTCLMPLAIKTQNDSFAFVHELKQEMHANLKYVDSLEKQFVKLESDKAEFSNMYDILLQECVSNDVMCTYLHSLADLDAHSELQCLYLPKVKECECLAQKLSKQNESVSKVVYTELL